MTKLKPGHGAKDTASHAAASLGEDVAVETTVASASELVALTTGAPATDRTVGPADLLAGTTGYFSTDSAVGQTKPTGPYRGLRASKGFEGQGPVLIWAVTLLNAQATIKRPSWSPTHSSLARRAP